MTDDKGLVRFNATRHGVLSRYTVLPWEDGEEYACVLMALKEEHAPQGPTEEHLVEELAGIVWRKRRLRLAEAAAHRQGLYKTMKGYSETGQVALAHLHGGEGTEGVRAAIRDASTDTEEALRDLEADEAMTKKALDLLGSRRNDRYEAAVAALREDTRDWWADVLTWDDDELEEGEEPYKPDPDHLRRFIDRHVLVWYGRRRTELTHRPLIRDQAFGEALDANKLEVLARYEVHLDRKLERMLTMLVRLKELRQSREPAA
ncbi:MAG TPA: hypothetical protein VE999_02130 [Gemmataceae bacterium]|jgi:hypothetical protein|nr:hypothetical protein [Gemmataceae bacterium]